MPTNEFLMDSDTYLKDRVGSVAVVLLDAKDEIPRTVAAHYLHKSSKRTICLLGKQAHVQRVGARRPRCLQEASKVRKQYDVCSGEGALEDGPLPA
jgi:hypothetical protein